MATPISGTTNFVQVVNGSPLKYQAYTAVGVSGNASMAIPGLYGQGETILNCALLGTGSSLANYFRVEAYGNSSVTGSKLLLGTLYSSLVGTGTAGGPIVGALLNTKLAQDCWLAVTPVSSIASTNIGLLVQSTTLGANAGPTGNGVVNA